MHFTLWLIWPSPSTRTPAMQVMKFTISRLFLGHHYYIHSLSDLCLWVQRKIFKEIMHYHYMTYMATPQHKTLWPGVHDIYNFGRYSLVIITIYLVWSMPGSGEDFLKKCINFTLFTQKLPPLWVGVMQFTISCLTTLQMLHTKDKDWPSSSWEEDVNGWCTPHEDGRQPIAIGHMSD